ncbi:hypothetical protein [Methylobacterium sp. E-046]|uniref:hypothetical protein n=1 Tax=Methylobacterium sp. E-046 TaxID=2836576 RepID=UPI001FB875EB|nr:hypothetical protein [Methylobacterium sp. E-046]MCJ2099362.1 hypothetical protein [Methylobacterium sp. E-046]
MSTIAEIAVHLDLSERRVRELQGMNVLPKAARGQMDSDVCRVAYIRYLRDLQPEPSQPGDLDPAQERARKDRALAEQTEMKNEETRGHLVEIAAVTAQVSREYGVIRQRFMGIRGKLSDALDPKQTIRVEGEIIEALEELSDPDKFDAILVAFDKQAKHKAKQESKK